MRQIFAQPQEPGRR
jgi:hypothetical protein